MQESIEETAQREVRQCLDIFGRYLGVELDEYPEITVSVSDAELLTKELEEDPSYAHFAHRIDYFVRLRIERAISHHDPETGRINIRDDQLAHGIAYFEEIAHFYRSLLVPKSDPGDQNVAVGEFCGRLGESIGRQLVDGTDLDHLFSHLPPRDNISDGVYSEAESVFSENIQNAIKGWQRIDEIDRGASLFLDSLERGLSLLHELLEAYHSDPESNNPAPMISEIAESILSDIGRLTKLNDAISLMYKINGIDYDLSPPDLDLLGCYRQLFENIGALTDSIDSPETREEWIGTVDHHKRYLAAENYLLSSEVIQLRNFYRKRTDLIENGLDHYYGYAAAELFVRDNPEFMQQISCIFRMPDDEVKERYFSNNKYQRLYESVKERLRMLKQAMGPEEQLPEKPVLQ